MSIKNNKIKNDIEFILFLLILLVIFLSYGPISHIAALRGINTAPLLVTRLDWMIPYQPFWIIFYSPALVIPTITLIAIRIKLGHHHIVVFCRLCYTFMLMALFCYAIFILIPCSVIDMFHIPPKIWSKTAFNDLVRIQFNGEAPFNDNPSLHVATGWLFVRYVYLYFNRFTRTIFSIWFAGMVISTLTLKVHIIENDIAAIIIAELCYRFIFLKHSTKFAMSWLRVLYVKRIVIYLIIIATIVLWHYWFIHKLGTLTDISTQNNLYLKVLM